METAIILLEAKRSRSGRRTLRIEIKALRLKTRVVWGEEKGGGVGRRAVVRCGGVKRRCGEEEILR